MILLWTIENKKIWLNKINAHSLAALFLVIYHFVNFHFCQLVIFATCYFANMPFCPLAILSTCHFVNLPFLSKCHFVNKMTSWQNDKLTKCQVDKMTQHPIYDKCYDTFTRQILNCVLRCMCPPWLLKMHWTFKVWCIFSSKSKYNYWKNALKNALQNAPKSDV